MNIDELMAVMPKAGPADLHRAWALTWHTDSDLPEIVKTAIAMIKGTNTSSIIDKARDNLVQQVTAFDKEDNALQALRKETCRSLDRIYFYKEVVKLGDADRRQVREALADKYQGEFTKEGTVAVLLYESIRSAVLYRLSELRFPEIGPDDWYGYYSESSQISHRQLVAALKHNPRTARDAFRSCLRLLHGEVRNLVTNPPSAMY